MPERQIKRVRVRKPAPADSAAKPAPGARAALIRRTKLKYPEMSQAQIARRVGCSRQNVSQVLAVFLAGHSEHDLRDFQGNRADIYDAIQMRALASVTQAKLQKASATSLVTAAAILQDKIQDTRYKIQAMRGQPTSMHVSVLMDVADLLRERHAERQRELMQAERQAQQAGKS